MSGFEMFVRTIPFNLYAMLTLYMVFFTSLLGFDFGLMKKHERNAAHGDLFTSGGEAFQNQEIKDPTEGGKFAKGKVIDLIAPMIVMILNGHRRDDLDRLPERRHEPCRGLCQLLLVGVACLCGPCHGGVPAGVLPAAPRYWL